MAAAKNILHVDDDIDDQILFKEAVACIDASLNVYVAKHGLDAISSLRTLPVHPAIIFLDINMPIMNGFECLEYLKRSEAFQHIPVIILTTSSSEEHRAKALTLAANAYIIKPMLFQELTREIKRCIEAFR